MKSKGSRRPRGEAIERELRSLRDEAQLASGCRPQARQASSAHVPPPDEKKQQQQQHHVQQRTAFSKQGETEPRAHTHTPARYPFFFCASSLLCLWGGKGVRRLVLALLETARSPRACRYRQKLLLCKGYIARVVGGKGENDLVSYHVS